MEGVLLLGLLGVGYVLNKDKGVEMDTTYKPPMSNHKESGTTIYNVANYRDSKAYERSMVQNFNDLSKEKGSNIIDTNNIYHPSPQSGNTIQSINGNTISNDDFLVNDQGIKVEPFISGSGPSNINFEENRPMIMHQGGPHSFKEPKKEMGQFFKVEKTYGNVFGNQFTGAGADQDRYIPGDLLTNELPFQQEKIQPIDSKSEINRDIGNIHAERNSVNNRRSINNPKLSYGGTILGGKGIEHRGEQGEIFKNLPDQDYLNTADKWLVTMGTTDAPLIRPGEVIPDTNRQYLNKGNLGPAAPVSYSTNEQRPMFKKSTNQQLDSDTMRNATMEGKAHDDAHNKGGYFVYPNERETSTDNYFVANPSPVYEADTTRIQDNVRSTIKETTNFQYTGIGGTSVPGTIASDQYLRADLNPSKEIIAQGRDPTPENVKITSGMDTVHMTIDKIESDYFTQHIRNPDKIYQDIPTDVACEYTRDRDTLDNRKLSDRLDASNLDPFHSNPFTHSLASF
mgnify:CR=1 FL=1|tara:strand:- start:125 stop:1657 length:1533 start_codon:yes stop_codon:yes gene_type:complete